LKVREVLQAESSSMTVDSLTVSRLLLTQLAVLLAGVILPQYQCSTLSRSLAHH